MRPGIRFCQEVIHTGFEKHGFSDGYWLILTRYTGDSVKENGCEGVRLDKWLWVARFYKTRALAREMIAGGKVHYNGQRTKPGKIVEPDATVVLRQGSDERTVIVKGMAEQRRPASEAVALYQETAQSVEKRAKMALARKLSALTMPHPDRHPDKKERRLLMKFKYGDKE